jgi:hypothetical protein
MLYITETQPHFKKDTKKTSTMYLKEWYLISAQCIRLLIKVLPEDGPIWPKHVAL